MTKTPAGYDAERMRDEILALLARLTLQHGRPTKPLKIARYPTSYDYRYMRPNDPWPWEHHSAVVDLLPGLLRLSGFEVRLVDCTAMACMAWLDGNGRVNDQAGRAAFIASVTAE